LSPLEEAVLMCMIQLHTKAEFEQTVTLDPSADDEDNVPDVERDEDAFDRAKDDPLDLEVDAGV
jgi:hypothetical protein